MLFKNFAVINFSRDNLKHKLSKDYFSASTSNFIAALCLAVSFCSFLMLKLLPVFFVKIG
jgi:hypothetical protein